MKHKVIRGETKVIDEAKGLIHAVVSTETEDRDGDIIRVAGWDLSHFNQHPILLASHNYFDLRSQIGQWEDMEVRKRDKRLEGTVRYYIGEEPANEDADWGFKLAQRGRAAYSVGFIPDMDKAKKRETKPGESFGGWEFNGQELLEVSHVTIPSNPEALQTMRTLGLHPVIDELAAEVIGTLSVSGENDPRLQAVPDPELPDALAELLEQLDGKLDRILAGLWLAQQAEAEQARVAIQQAVTESIADKVKRHLEGIHA